MKFIRVIYIALAALISAASCTKEAAEPDVYDWADGKIVFKTSLADVASSRAQDMTLDDLESFQVTCFNTENVTKDEDGYISPYFENATFVRQDNPTGVVYVSSPYEEPREWPNSGGIIKFIAFSPSLSIMTSDNSALNGANFTLQNRTKESNSSIEADYGLEKMRINRDISRQFDFLTATASGERWKDFASSVELAFSHQMSQIELHAWGNGSGYDFEIAGVRIGNAVVEGDFMFSDGSNPNLLPHWKDAGRGIKDKVEYQYRSHQNEAATASTQIGDTIFKINKDNHNVLGRAGSIMGHGGCAMVIPTVNAKWEGLADPNIGTTPYNTERMYFSILMRVTTSSSGYQLYPYPGNPDGLTVVYYAVDAAGAIRARVYPGSEKGEYFSDSLLQDAFEAEEGIEIKEFGWATVPVDANWSAGKRYVYTLDYSAGVGVHDPEDPKPGTPIIEQGKVPFSVGIEEWHPAEDYESNLDVPKN